MTDIVLKEIEGIGEKIQEDDKKDVPSMSYRASKILHINSEEKGCVFEYLDKKEKLLLPMLYKILIETNQIGTNDQVFLNS